jgi:AcrR family transcriptional regulator
MQQTRAPRADAVRNRNKILVAAREQITLHGPQIGMDEIAAAAGVAVGTLYRHFPTKTDLVAAVIAQYVDDVADRAEAANARAATGAQPIDELTEFLGYVVEASATDRAVKAAAQALGAQPTNTAGENRATKALAQLIKAARADGDIYPDVSVDDLYLLFANAPTDREPAARSRWLILALRALTMRPAPGRRTSKDPTRTAKPKSRVKHKAGMPRSSS